MLQLVLLWLALLQYMMSTQLGSMALLLPRLLPLLPRRVPLRLPKDAQQRLLRPLLAMLLLQWRPALLLPRAQ